MSRDNDDEFKINILLKTKQLGCFIRKLKKSTKLKLRY